MSEQEKKIFALLENPNWKLRYGQKTRLDSGYVTDKNIIEMYLTNTTYSRRIYINRIGGILGVTYGIRFWEENKESLEYAGDYKKLFEQLENILAINNRIDLNVW